MSQVIELEYPRASLWKRCFAFLFDFLCAAVLTSCLAAGGSAILPNLSFYASSQKTMGEIELQSGLYREENGKNVRLSDYFESEDTSTSVSETTYTSRNEAYEKALSDFYGNTLFFSGTEGQAIYNGLKTGTSITFNNASYFEYQEVNGQSQIVLREGISSAQADVFYVDCLDNYAIPQISLRSENYLAASRTIFWSMFLLVYLWALLSLAIFFILVPLLFKRGYQTFGKKLFHLSLLNARAVSPSKGQFWGRSSLLFWVEFVLSSASFGLPFLVSFTMMMSRKDEQSFHDYVAGTYVVDSSDEFIYLSYEEYQRRNASLDTLTLKDTTQLSEKH